MSRKNVWAITALVGLYVICQAIADVGATRLLQIGSIVLPGGTFIFAVTFTLRDLLHKRLGKEWARAAIVLAGGFNVLQAVYLSAIGHLPAPAFAQLAGAWSQIFAIVPSITVASIVAEVVSELIDTEVYHFWSHRFRRLPQWTRVVVSNAISLPVDSLIFATLAFVFLPPLLGGDSMPFLTALSLVAGQIVYKAAVTLISLPGIYLVKERPLLPAAGEGVAYRAV